MFAGSVVGVVEATVAARASCAARVGSAEVAGSGTSSGVCSCRTHVFRLVLWASVAENVAGLAASAVSDGVLGQSRHELLPPLLLLLVRW